MTISNPVWELSINLKITLTDMRLKLQVVFACISFFSLEILINHSSPSFILLRNLIIYLFLNIENSGNRENVAVS